MLVDEVSMGVQGSGRLITEEVDKEVAGADVPMLLVLLQFLVSPLCLCLCW